MPRIREAIANGDSPEEFDLETASSNLLLVYSAGRVFLEMLHEVSKLRGTYHTIGSDRLFSKFLVTSTSNGNKFYAGGSRLDDLLGELKEEYGLSDKDLEDALETSERVQKAKRVLR